MWPEVQTAKAEQRHELVLHGKDVSDRVQAAGGCVDEEVFSLVKLNFLEISEAKLQTVPETLSSLVNLTSLVLKSNQLTKVPDGINRWLWKQVTYVTINAIGTSCISLIKSKLMRKELNNPQLLLRQP